MFWGWQIGGVGVAETFSADVGSGSCRRPAHDPVTAWWLLGALTAALASPSALSVPAPHGALLLPDGAFPALPNLAERRNAPAQWAEI